MCHKHTAHVIITAPSAAQRTTDHILGQNIRQWAEMDSASG
jgi:hypothetical protein